MARYDLTLNLDGETVKALSEIAANYRDTYQARLNEYSNRLRSNEGLVFQDDTDRERYDRTMTLRREFGQLAESFGVAAAQVREDRIKADVGARVAKAVEGIEDGG